VGRSPLEQERRRHRAKTTPLGDLAGTLSTSGIFLGSLLGASGVVPDTTFYMVKPAYVLLSVLFGALVLLAKYPQRQWKRFLAVLEVLVLTGVISQPGTVSLLTLEIQHSAARREIRRWQRIH
jgi:hypothetical protein